jgi:hypothetical protein
LQLIHVAVDQLGRHQSGEDFRPSGDWGGQVWQEGGLEDFDLADLLERLGQRAAGSQALGATNDSVVTVTFAAAGPFQRIGMSEFGSVPDQQVGNLLVGHVRTS